MAVVNTYLEPALVALLLCQRGQEHEDGSNDRCTYTDDHGPVHCAYARSRWRLPLEVPDECDGQGGQGHGL